VPGVVRADGFETFRLEVEVRSEARAVRLNDLSPLLQGPGGDPIELHDDGETPDLCAGDGVWTAGPFRFDPDRSMSERFADDPASPAGLAIVRLGRVQIEEPSGASSEFLIAPSVGLLSPQLPVAPIVQSTGDLVVSRHLINLRSTERLTQKCLRSLDRDVSRLTRRVYAALPDVFDFLFFFSADKLERPRRDAAENFTSGSHLQVRNAFARSVEPDEDTHYGSAGRLLGVNVLDAYERGIAGSNATHELLHQWSSRAPGPWSDASGHYRPESNAGSLLGGFRWSGRGNGGFVRDCGEGRNGAHHAAPLDLYMMGLIDEAAVPPLRIAREGASVESGAVAALRTATPIEVRALRGLRAHAAGPARRDFHLGFVIESNGRFLTDTERTFYDRLAEHYVSAPPARSPDPYVGANWPTITRFFGHGTTWTSDIVAMSPTMVARIQP
jgi:hypothetical protein